MSMSATNIFFYVCHHHYLNSQPQTWPCSLSSPASLSRASPTRNLSPAAAPTTILASATVPSLHSHPDHTSLADLSSSSPAPPYPAVPQLPEPEPPPQLPEPEEEQRIQRLRSSELHDSPTEHLIPLL